MEYKLTFKEYSEALQENRLLGLKCQDCGAITVPPKMVCGQCTRTNLEITELKGNGKIQTFTVVNVAAEGRESEVPYIIVLVELDEGPWIMGNLAIEAQAATYDGLMDNRVKMEKGDAFTGDKFSAGEGTRPIFRLER